MVREDACFTHITRIFKTNCQFFCDNNLFKVINHVTNTRSLLSSATHSAVFKPNLLQRVNINAYEQDTTHINHIPCKRHFPTVMKAGTDQSVKMVSYTWVMVFCVVCVR